MSSRHAQQVVPYATDSLPARDPADGAAADAGRDTAREAGQPARESVHVQSVERAAALLRAVAAASGPSATAAALAEAVGLNRTTTWRILATLEHERLVSHDRRTGWYSLGFGLIDLAGQAGGALARTAREVLDRVAARSGETAALAVLRDDRLVYVGEATAGAVVAAGWQGRQVPLHATSTGKVLLAYSGPQDVRRLLGLNRGGRLPRFTPTTTTSLTELERELDEIRDRGYADCRGEFETTAWGVSAPVLDLSGRPVAVLSIWGPSDRLTADRFPELGELATAAAQEISGGR